MNTTTYEDIDQFVTLTHNTALKLGEYKNGGDCLLLYIRYIQQRKMQNNSTTFSNDVFMIKAMGWNKERFYRAKKVLLENNLIISVVRKTEEGKIEGHYIKVNFIITTHQENQSIEKAESGNLGTNTLVEKENTLITNKNTQKKEILSKKSVDSKLENNITVQQAVETWNSIKGFPNVIKITDAITRQWNIVKKQYTQEECELAINNYYDDTSKRTKTNDPKGYDKHRFTFYEFIKQNNGLQKRLNA